MKKAFIVMGILIVMTISLFALTGCKVSAETYDNGVSVEVDDSTKNTFENVLDWIQERLHRIFKTDSANNYTMKKQSEITLNGERA